MAQTARKTLCALMALAALSCTKQESLPVNTDAADLTISVAMPEITLSTKARGMYRGDSGKAIVADPFGEDLSEWSDYEKLIDARMLYRLTIFMMDKSNGELVGYRDLYLGSGDIRSADDPEGKNGWTADSSDGKYGSGAAVTFNYDHPLHDAVSDSGKHRESLNRGLYRMFMIANFNGIQIDAVQKDGSTVTRTYQGLKNHDGTALETYVDKVIEQFNGGTVESGKLTDYEGFSEIFNFTLYSSDDEFLCPIAPQPLSLISDFQLQPGRNNVSGHLTRCWARLRVTVENVSEHELTVHDFTFGDNTTKNESYLFFAPDNPAGSIVSPGHGHTKYGAPKILSETEEEWEQYNSLISAVKDTKIAKWDSPDGNSRIIFDGYILDCDGKDEPFTYTLDLEYEGREVEVLERAKKEDGTWDILKDDVSGIEDDGLYVLQNQNKQYRIAYQGNGQLETEQIDFNRSPLIFTPEQVFRFKAIRDGDGIKTETVGDREYPMFQIQTYDGLYWVGRPRRDKNIQLFPISANVSDDPSLTDGPTVFTVRDDGWCDRYVNGVKTRLNGFLSFWSNLLNEKGKRDYINIYGGDSTQNQIRGWEESDNGSQFYLHKVVKNTYSAEYRGTVTLSTIDEVTAVSRPVSSIVRNDFINIHITASYNDRTGNFSFTVRDWNTGGDDGIEFN